MRINLLPVPSLAQRIRSWAAFGLAAVLLGANVLLAFFWVSVNVMVQQQQNALDRVEREIQQLQPAYEEHNRLMLLSEQYRVLTRWADSRPALRTDLERLASLLPGQSFISQVELIDAKTYWLRATLPSMVAVSSYIHATERHPAIAQVKVLGVDRNDNGRYELEMQATMNRES